MNRSYLVRILFNQYNIASAISLVKQVLEDEADGPICDCMKIWHTIFDFVTQANELGTRTKHLYPRTGSHLIKLSSAYHSDTALLLQVDFVDTRRG